MQANGVLRATELRQRFAAVGLTTLAIPIALMAFHAAQSGAQVQTQTAVPATYQFEVASIRPSNPDAPGGYMTILGSGSDRFSARSLELMLLIRAAYGIPMGAGDNRIAGGPNWLRSEKYDVDATIDAKVVDELKTLSREQRMQVQQEMLQAFFAERCKLAIHRETKNLAIYTLVVAKNGPKLNDANPGETTSMGIS